MTHGEVKEEEPAAELAELPASAGAEIAVTAPAVPVLPVSAKEPEVTPCMNCGSPLRGAYCSSCGQRHEPHVHSILEFAGEAFESITHADSRVWRTLWLLMAKPGFLTREFLEGRRVSYLPPFRLYLVMSVLLFLVIAFAGRDTKVVDANASANRSYASAGAVEPRENETPAERAQRRCEGYQLKIPGVSEERARAVCAKGLKDDGHALAESMLHNIPRALFLLLPLLALVMQLLYWRRKYVEHLLFFIHNHAFTFALYAILIGVMSLVSNGWLTALGILLMIFYPPLYTYRAMRRVYPQNRWLTRLKFVVLVFGYVNLMFVMALVTVSYSAATL